MALRFLLRPILATSSVGPANIIVLATGSVGPANICQFTCNVKTRPNKQNNNKNNGKI